MNGTLVKKKKKPDHKIPFFLFLFLLYLHWEKENDFFEIINKDYWSMLYLSSSNLHIYY